MQAARRNPKLKAKKPVSIFKKPLQANFKELFKALSKGIGHTATAKWDELGSDTAELLSAIGLVTDPAELAFLLIRRSLARALFDLVGNSASSQLVEPPNGSDSLLDQMNFSGPLQEVQIGPEFLDRPGELQLLKDIQPLLLKWLDMHGIPQFSANAIVARLPSYFVYALNDEWRANAKSYLPVLDALNTPFSKAGEQQWAWTEYTALLERRIQEGIFDEPFSLAQIYVPLNAYYEETTKETLTDDTTLSARARRRTVVSLQEELKEWLDTPDSESAIRIISGGPGSGKSSFARIFAAKISQQGRVRVLFVPLHLIDASRDLVDEVGRFVHDEAILLQNPLDSESPERSLLIIFDGLDELASQGKVAAETARAFVREVERTVERRNVQGIRIRVLISGREVVIQESESEFRRPKQVLTLLPYFVPRQTHIEHQLAHDRERYHDPADLLKTDLRNVWWKNYALLTGRKYKALPAQLNREDLTEITAQPLLNYLVALSFTRDKLDFTSDINLNAIYEDLVVAVYERAYEKRRSYAPIRQMKLDEFFRVLEEVGLAAWHGDGRTTTVREIEEHCRASGLGKLLEVFQDGAKAGVTRLLAAFFFRQYGQRPSGDPTFMFTHKSFGEYLAGRRVIRTADRVIRELKHSAVDPDGGWDERAALKHWAQICGPSAISPYLHIFLLNEVKLRPKPQLVEWQTYFATLFGYCLRLGMPMEQLQISTFKEQQFQSRNAEEALLAILNACARITETISVVKPPGFTGFATWFKRVQGQRTGPESSLAAQCLSLLDLSGSCVDICDLYNADLSYSDLRRLEGVFACFSNADMPGANLEKASLSGASFNMTRLGGANLREASLIGSDFSDADLDGANLEGVHAEASNFRNATLKKANLKGVDLEAANLKGVNLKRANLKGANLGHANLRDANLRGAILKDLNFEVSEAQEIKRKGQTRQTFGLEPATLENANLEGADLEGANLAGADLEGANLEDANLQGATLRESDLKRAGSPVGSGTYTARSPDSARHRARIHSRRA